MTVANAMYLQYELLERKCTHRIHFGNNSFQPRIEMKKITVIGNTFNRKQFVFITVLRLETETTKQNNTKQKRKKKVTVFHLRLVW